MNGTVRFTYAMILVVVLTACATPTQILPTPVEATSTPFPPTAIPATTSPTKSNFMNALVYDPPEMYDIPIETFQYTTPGGKTDTLSMDIFYPPDRKPGEILPAVIIVNGWPNNENWGSKSFAGYQSWGRLIAASGLIAVAYDTRNENDLETVINYLQQNGAKLGIDGNRLGFWSGSSSSGLASNFAFQEGREYLKFAVFYYAWIMTPDNFEREEEDATCRTMGCLGSQLPDVKQLRTDLPLLVVRPGKDSSHNLAIIDHFTELATEAEVPLILIKFDEGYHGFDWKKNSFGATRDKAIEIIKQTLEFMKQHAYDP